MYKKKSKKTRKHKIYSVTIYNHVGRIKTFHARNKNAIIEEIKKRNAILIEMEEC